jgi:hypothetical protein
MRRTLAVLTLAIALLAAACGTDNDADTSVGGPPDVPAVSAPDTGGGTEPDVGEPVLGAGPYPIGDITITVTLDVDADPAVYRLACLGDTATLTGDSAPGDAATMCLALDDLPIRDRLVNGPPAGQLCTQQYGGPEVANLSGTLDGDAVDADLHRADGCGISDWQLFSAFVPSA